MKKILISLLCVFIFCLAARESQAQFRKAGKQTLETKDENTPSQSDTTKIPPPADDHNDANVMSENEYTIAGIEVEGLQVLDKSAMLSISGLRVGDKIRIPGESTTRAIQKLWKHGLVGDASILIDRIVNHQVYLRFLLSERPRLSDFFFTGISKAKQSSLKDDLKLIRGKIINDALIRNTEASIKKHFVKKGFLNCTVRVTPLNDTLNRGNVRLKIDVKPNAKVKIDHIIFEGNNDISTSKLKWKLKKTKEYARFTLPRAIINEIISLRPSRLKHWADSGYAVRHRNRSEFIKENVKLIFFNGSKFIRSDYEEDKKKLIDFYNSGGYRDAEIKSDTLIRRGKSTVEVRIMINEGKKYFLRNITWLGNYAYSSDVLNKVLNIKKGDVYNRELLEKRLTFDNKSGDVSGLYMDDGYLFFNAVPTEVAVVGDSIDLEIRLHEGDKATINEVRIAGNERTQENVVRRELNTIPGRKFSRSDLIRTQQILGQVGYFNPQKITPDIKPNPANSLVDINWKVEEQSSDQVQLSGGWGGFYGFVGTVGLTFNNFSIRDIPHFKRWRPLPVGSGQKLSLQVQANGRSFQSYSISFTEPWLGGAKPNSLSVGLNYSISRSLYAGQGSFGFSISDYYLRQLGINVGLGRRLSWPDNYFTLLNSIGFTVYTYKNYFTQTDALPREGQTNQIKFETTLARNSISNPYYPTSGSSISLSLTLTPPYSLFRNISYYNDLNNRYSWLELYKIMFDSKFYLTLLGSKKAEGGRSLVLEAKAHFGYLGAYDDRVPTGPFERFLLGGAGLAGGFNSFVLGQDIVGLRGYPDNSVTPPFYNQGRNSQSTQEISGGLIYGKFGAEIRYPVVIGQAATIYGLVFAEAGNNWNDYRKINPFNLYRSAGVGARLFMPAFGLIGLNWAYGFDTLPFSDRISGSQFHFTIGQQIR